MMKIFSWLFRKKKEFPMPSEYLLVQFTEEATKHNLREDINKEIVYYKDGDVFKKYGYSKVLLKTLSKELNLPLVDFTKIGPKEIQVNYEVTPEDEIKYEVEE